MPKPNLVKSTNNLREDQLLLIREIISGTDITQSDFLRKALDFYLENKGYEEDFKNELGLGEKRGDQEK